MSPSNVSIPHGKVLVTGATGHLGANLVRRLLADGHDLRILVEPSANRRGIDGLPAEVVIGDIRDAQAVRNAVQGCTRVFHVAAKVSTLTASPHEERDIFAINVLGTRNVMVAAQECDVARVVLTGSLSAVGYDLDDPHQPSNEDMPHYPFDFVLPYARSKALAEHEALKAAAEGLDVVIATSCAIMGPNDFLPSRLGRVLCDFASGRLRAYIPGGFDFVAARDIVEGHVLSMERGRRGQKYIFSTCFQTMDELFDHYEQVTGRRRPRWRLPPKVAEGFSKIYYGVAERYFPDAPQRLTPAAIKLLSMRRRADTSKARRELGFEPTSLRSAIEEAYEFFVRERMVERPALVGAAAAAE